MTTRNSAPRPPSYTNPQPGRLHRAGAQAAQTLTRAVQNPATFLGSFVAAYIFLLTSRVLDVSTLSRLHIPLLMLIVLTIALFATGGFNYAFSAKATKFFTAFTLWVVLCYPFSTWRAGSTESVEWQLQALLIYLIVVQLVRTRSDWERVTSFYAYATLASAILSFVIGISMQGRIALPGGSLGDPNEFSIFMVVGLPFWWSKAYRSGSLGKVFYIGCTIPIYIAFARAGSRSGMLALLVLCAATFYFATGGKKVMIAVVAVAGLAVAFVALPGYLRARYFTFFSSNDSLDADTRDRLGSDIASTEARRGLLISSFRLSFQHPVLGVGPGVFNMVGWEDRKLNFGSGGMAQVSHNTYTQISSETGFPGFTLYFSTIVLCLRGAFRAYRRLKNVDPDYAVSAKYMLFAIASLSVGSFFLSIGYTYLLSIMFALCTSLHLMVNQHLKDQELASRVVGRQQEELVTQPSWGGLPARKRLQPRRPAKRWTPPALPTGN